MSGNTQMCTHTGQATLCGPGSQSPAEETHRGRTRGHGWPGSGLEWSYNQRLYFCPRCVLNHGGSGVAPWCCGEADLVEMSGILHFSCRTYILAGQGWASSCSRRMSFLAGCEQRGKDPCPGSGVQVSPGQRCPMRV